ncbi:hypothetical protein FNV43_RR03812 [Rhamnella rubrinervis]|uniref:Zinc finger PHD-type domain-containing protein n=1 Tax=Rhamnella rubrinervis TaxID=2594499 RepID=A0A8K0HIM9_9ROSA|nr:hypothetical protein FNV43_RR03812 [Rhamnella rubrinervis]
MASSDDEAEALPQSVSNYHFVDEKDEPISFSLLPIQWSKDNGLDGKKIQIFLHGIADNGLQKIYKRVIAWKFDLSNVKPMISVLSKENNWIKLQKPRKSFEDIIRSILITLHCLHFVKRNPETSSKSLWNHLSKIFSSYQIRPSQNDLVDQMPLICEAVERDNALAKSKFLLAFLKEKPRKRKVPEADIKPTPMSGFIVDDADEFNSIEEDDTNVDDDDDLDPFDSVCAICDNGGDIMCCEGKCFRSFHATEEAGAESFCYSLGFFSKEEAEAIPVFLCKNCENDQHQCFVCGKLGSSDDSSGAEVFRCVNATCGHFYHPHCVAKLVHLDYGVSAEELGKKISEGESFVCPVHKCCVCKKIEDKEDPEKQFAVCRRCPTSYHRTCLPKEIVFDDEKNKDVMIRAWEGLLPYHILIYCLNHEIDEELKTPIRDHIIFPGVENERFSGSLKTGAEGKKRKQTSELQGDREKLVSNKRIIASGKLYEGRIARAAFKQKEKSSAVKVGGYEKTGKLFSGSNSARKVKGHDVSRKELKSPNVEENKLSLGDRLFDLMNKGSEQLRSGKQDRPNDELNKAAKVTLPTKNLSNDPPPLDANSERRLLLLMEDAASSITMEDILKKQKVPSTHACSSKNAVDKNITMGKLESSIQAVRTALQQLEKGCSIEHAQAVCEPEVLRQIYKWKKKLRVYLAPFLYGMRYTSFGRHFTKVDKIEEIVNKLHCYVQEGDMVVDFSCGANDFSILMSRKLEETGKKCLYKNYDVFQPKNDFNFENRDWMTVQPHELPSGSRLIMGLNPPFGVKASLANVFIDKALEFNPKLLILIVPPETERLDEKESPYDLVWKDDQTLSGKPFYLPGSVDVNDKQMEQWNLMTPLLYLWSHPDWSAEHKAIAEKYGHVFRQQEPFENLPRQSIIPDHPMGNHDDYVDNDMLITDDLPVQTDHLEGFKGGVDEIEGHKEISHSSKGSSDRATNESCGLEKNQSKKKSSKQMADKGKQRRGKGEIPGENKLKYGGRSARELQRGMPSRKKVGENSHRHFEAARNGSWESLPDNMSRRHSMKVAENPCVTSKRWSGSASPASNYGVRNLDDQTVGSMRDNRDSFGRRSPYMVGEMEEKLRREALVSPDPIYGQTPPHPATAYRHVGGLAAETSYGMYTNSSAMQRYAPRLDEPPGPMFSRNSFYDHRVDPIGFAPPPPPPPGHHVGPIGFAPCPYQIPPLGPIGFAPGSHRTPPGGSMGYYSGPQQNLPHWNSGGWLNE